MRELRGPSSQAEMARGVGVKQQNWARWECDVVTPSAEMIAKICTVHACSSDWLLGIERDKSAAATVHGSGIAIANSPHAKASVVIESAVESSACKKCKYLKAIKKLQKAGLKLPDE